jgi:hypothetical protein
VLGDAAKDAAEHLNEPAQPATESVKDTAPAGLAVAAKRRHAPVANPGQTEEHRMAAIRAIPEAARSRRSINACWEAGCSTGPSLGPEFGEVDEAVFRGGCYENLCLPGRSLVWQSPWRNAVGGDAVLAKFDGERFHQPAEAVFCRVVRTRSDPWLVFMRAGYGDETTSVARSHHAARGAL